MDHDPKQVILHWQCPECGLESTTTADWITLNGTATCGNCESDMAVVKVTTED